MTKNTAKTKFLNAFAKVARTLAPARCRVVDLEAQSRELEGKINELKVKNSKLEEKADGLLYYKQEYMMLFAEYICAALKSNLSYYKVGTELQETKFSSDLYGEILKQIENNTLEINNYTGTFVDFTNGVAIDLYNGTLSCNKMSCSSFFKYNEHTLETLKSTIALRMYNDTLALKKYVLAAENQK